MGAIEIKRKTKETDIQLSFRLNGIGKSEISTGIGFFDHMLTLFAFHGCFDLELSCKGDLEVCGHHTVEDVGIVLGQAFHQGFNQKQNIVRYSTALIPMDESLARAVIDISGRPCLAFDAAFERQSINGFDTELVKEFFTAFTNNAGITMHLSVVYGENTHHKIEALFKACGVALRHALEEDPKRQGSASTKGAL